MTFTVYLAPLVALVGMVVYLVAANPKAADVGRIAFAAGLLVTLLVLGGERLR